MILLTVGVGAGCGQSYQPTVRRVSYRPDEAKQVRTAIDSPAAHATCPGMTGHDQAVAKTEPTPYQKGLARRMAAARGKAVDLNVLLVNHGSLPSGVEPADSSPATSAGAPEARAVRLGRLRLVAPESWTPAAEPVPFALAVFRLPRADGDPSDAELTVAEVSHPRDAVLEGLAGAPVEKLAVDGAEVVLADSTGEAGDPADPLPAPVSDGRYRALNAYVFSDGKVFAINCTGPEKTVEQRLAEVRGFLQSLTPAS